MVIAGRQAWRLIHGDDSLLGKVMKSKYYPNCNFLEASLGYNCSFSWKSIWSSKALVKEGTLWSVGNGINIDIWRDRWVPDNEGFKITSEENEQVSRVIDLIDNEKMEWNYNLISEIFNDQDKKCISAIPLSERAPYGTRE